MKNFRNGYFRRGFMERKIRDVIATIEDLSFDAYLVSKTIDLNELGLESLQMIQIIVGIEEMFGVDISVELSLEDAFTINSIMDEIIKGKGRKNERD